MSFTTLKEEEKKNSPRGEMHPNYAMLVLCRARPGKAVDGGGGGGGLTLLALLLTQELEYGGEIFIGVTARAHHTVHLMG